ncbi:MAG: hypothetical protein ABSH08_05175 [Tepidisphaeraceae bacterium]|jgi:hypothetical protein
MNDLRRWLLHAIVALSLVLSATTLGVAVLSCFCNELADWVGTLAPDGHQNWVRISPFMGQTDISFMRISFLPAIRAHYLAFNGGLPIGWRIQSPVRFQTRSDSAAFVKNHRAFGLFTFGIERIDYNLVTRMGLPINERGWRVTFPLWWLALFFGIVPAMAFLRRRRSTRDASGLCIKCGYDLRATPDRCPECGTIPPKRELSQSEPVLGGRAP